MIRLALACSHSSSVCTPAQHVQIHLHQRAKPAIPLSLRSTSISPNVYLHALMEPTAITLCAKNALPSVRHVAMLKHANLARLTLLANSNTSMAHGVIVNARTPSMVILHFNARVAIQIV